MQSDSLPLFVQATCNHCVSVQSAKNSGKTFEPLPHDLVVIWSQGGMTALHMAAQKGKCSVLEICLGSPTRNIDAVDEVSNTTVGWFLKLYRLGIHQVFVQMLLAKKEHSTATGLIARTVAFDAPDCGTHTRCNVRLIAVNWTVWLWFAISAARGTFQSPSWSF